MGVHLQRNIFREVFTFQTKKTWAFFAVVSNLFEIYAVDHLPSLLSPWIDGCRNSKGLELWKLTFSSQLGVCFLYNMKPFI